MRPKQLKNFGSNIPILGRKKKEPQRVTSAMVMERGYATAMAQLASLFESYKAKHGEDSLRDPEHQKRYREMMKQVCVLPSSNLAGAFAALTEPHFKDTFTIQPKGEEAEKIAVYTVRGEDAIASVDKALGVKVDG